MKIEKELQLLSFKLVGFKLFYFENTVITKM